MHFCEWKFGISIRISLKFVPKGPIDNKSALVQVMARCRTGDEPLPEPMLTRFTDAYMRHWGEMSRVVTALVRCAGGWAAPRFETHRSCWWKYMHLFSRLFDIFHVNIYGFAVNCVGSNNKTESVTSMESSETTFDRWKYKHAWSGRLSHMRPGTERLLMCNGAWW